MSKYEYKVFHKETGEEIHEENFSQYFSQYIALDSDGDLVEIDSRDAVVVSVVDYAYIKFNKSDEYEAKAKAFDAICKAHVPLEKRMSPVTVDEGLDFAVETEKIILKFYESGEPNAKK